MRELNLSSYQNLADSPQKMDPTYIKARGEFMKLHQTEEHVSETDIDEVRKKIDARTFVGPGG